MATSHSTPKLTHAGKTRLETFSFLPTMDASDIRAQVSYMVEQGWQCAVEHAAPEHATDSYWTMWNLPMFGERGIDTVIQELNACRNAHPDHHIRLTAYDPKKQTQGLAMVVHRANG